MYKLLYLARRQPAIAREDWPRTWRSHARFAGRFPGLPDGIRYSRYCNRVDAAAGPPAPGAIPLGVDYDGVAVACSESLELLQGGAFNAGQFEQILEDERRVFDRPTSESSFYCVEHPVREGPLGAAVLVMFLARHPALSRLAFKDWLLAQHAEVDSVDRYTCNLPLHVPPASLPFDAIIECWSGTLEAAFQSEQNLRRLPGYQDVAQHCDVRRSVAVLSEVCMRWPLSD